MRLSPDIVVLAAFLGCSPALAETVEVKMLNRGEGGAMLFEPDFVQLEPGDAIRFVVGHRSHNAASIDGLHPQGFEPFIGRIDEEIEVTFDEAGTYGIQCTPHYAMGMVMVVQVGDGEAELDLAAAAPPPRARQRFEEILERAAANP